MEVDRHAQPPGWVTFVMYRSAPGSTPNQGPRGCRSNARCGTSSAAHLTPISCGQQSAMLTWRPTPTRPHPQGQVENQSSKCQVPWQGRRPASLDRIRSHSSSWGQGSKSHPLGRGRQQTGLAPLRTLQDKHVKHPQRDAAALLPAASMLIHPVASNCRHSCQETNPSQPAWPHAWCQCEQGFNDGCLGVVPELSNRRCCL